VDMTKVVSDPSLYCVRVAALCKPSLGALFSKTFY
jgi:hypothetical protein